MLRKGKELFFRTKANPERGEMVPKCFGPISRSGVPSSACTHKIAIVWQSLADVRFTPVISTDRRNTF